MGTFMKLSYLSNVNQPFCQPDTTLSQPEFVTWHQLNQIVLFFFLTDAAGWNRPLQTYMGRLVMTVYVALYTLPINKNK